MPELSVDEEFFRKLGKRYPSERSGDREPIPWQARAAVLLRDDRTCKFCGTCIPEGRGLEIDHVIPWSSQGSDRAENLRTLCHGCNRSRSNRFDGTERIYLPVTWWCRECTDMTPHSWVADSQLNRGWLTSEPIRDPELDDIERGRHWSCWACMQPWWQIVLAQPTSDADLLVPQLHADDVLAFCAHCRSTGYAWWSF